MKIIKIKKTTIIILIGVAIIAAAISVAAASYWMMSPSRDLIVDPTPTPPPQATLSLEISQDRITYGESVTLMATVSDAAEGVTVNFYEGAVGEGTQIGTAVTDDAGSASWTVTSPSVGTHTYHARANHP